MGTVDESSALPPPSPECLDDFEDVHKLRLPETYRRLQQSFHGAQVVDGVISADGEDRLVERFLCMLDAPVDHPRGWDDIEVVIAQIDDRLCSADEVGWSLIPIAALFAGDYLCLDYRASRSDPGVVIWDHERSEEFEPFTVPVAASFDEFLGQFTL